MELPQPRRLSLDEFLEIDAGSDERLEYRGGFIVAQATPPKNHARIAGNLAMHLGPLARVSGSDFFAGDAKVVMPDGSRVIPDFVVTCDPRDRDAPDERGEAIVRHPWLVVEILSPATAADDTTQKLDLYESIPGSRTSSSSIRDAARFGTTREATPAVFSRIVRSRACSCRLRSIVRSPSTRSTGTRPCRPEGRRVTPPSATMSDVRRSPREVSQREHEVVHRWKMVGDAVDRANERRRGMQRAGVDQEQPRLPRFVRDELAEINAVTRDDHSPCGSRMCEDRAI